MGEYVEWEAEAKVMFLGVRTQENVCPGDLEKET